MPVINTDDQRYIEIKKRLNIAQKNGKKKILSVHFPGTGGKSESGFPTRKAFIPIEKIIPIVKLEGAGSGEKAPVHGSTTSLSFQEKVRTWFSLPSSKSESESSEPEGLNKFINKQLGKTKVGGNIGGIVTGAGEDENNEIIMNLLETLAQDGDPPGAEFPEEIVLTGHSRGAINSIYLANEIYAKYGDKIKIHLILTDPVPGPFHEMEWKKRVIPPNVVTFTAFYAEKHENILFQPHDLSRLTFTNPDTVVTSYSTLDDHSSICGNPKVESACFDIISGIYDISKDSNFSLKDSGRLQKSLDMKYYTEMLQDCKDEEEREKIIKTFVDEQMPEKEVEIRKTIIQDKENEYTKQFKNKNSKLSDLEIEIKVKEKIGQDKDSTEEQVKQTVKETKIEWANYIKNRAPRSTETMHSKDNYSRKHCQYVAKTEIDKKDQNGDYILNENLRNNLKKIRRENDLNPETLKKPPHIQHSSHKMDSIKGRLSYLHQQHRKGNYYNISSNEIAAIILLVPTLGLSATLFKTMEQYDNKFLIITLGIFSINILTSLSLLVNTAEKLKHNIAEGGFLRPGYKIEEEDKKLSSDHDQSETIDQKNNKM